MSQYGMKIVNDQGQIILSDKIESLHLLQGGIKHSGKERLQYAFKIRHRNDPLEGAYRYAYSVHATGSLPVVFVRAAWNAPNMTYAVTDLRKIGTRWHFNIYVGGKYSAYYAPTAYIFVRANDLPRNGEKYGLVVRDNHNKITFDTRWNPLGILGSTDFIAPSHAAADGTSSVSGQKEFAWNDSRLDFNFHTYTKSQRMSMPSMNNNFILFTAPSVAKNVTMRRKYGYKESDKWSGGTQKHYSTATWWVYYMQGVRVQSGNIMNGWITLSSYYHFTSHWNSGGIGGGSGGSNTSGYVPPILNTVGRQLNNIIVTDVRWYS